MNEIQTSIDALEFAVEIENNGKQFYEKLVRTVEDNDARQLFRQLADMEQKHIVEFSEILQKVKTYIPEQAYPQEYFSYFNNVASEHIFRKNSFRDLIFREIADAIDALTIAIDFEKQSVELYQKMKKIIPEDAEHLIDILIEQEKLHEKMLLEQKEKIGNK